MDKIDRLYKKALQASRSLEEHERLRLSSRAVPAYFAIASYCFSNQIDFPEINTDEGISIFQDIFSKEERGIAFDEFMEWFQY